MMRFDINAGAVINSGKWLGVFILPLAFMEHGRAASLGNLDLTPSVSLEHAYIDNLYYQPQNQVDSWKTIVIPTLKMSGDLRSFTASLSVSGEKGVYSDSSDDDYFDTFLLFKSNYELNHSNAIQLQATYDASHEDRGTGLSDGQAAFLVDSPIEYNESSLVAKYVIGSESSRGKLVFRGSFLEKEYTNFERFTDRHSYKTVFGGTRFYLRMGKGTRLLIDGQVGSTDYLYDPAAIDGVEDSFDRQFKKLQIGATWDLTTKTQGTIKAGYRSIDFKDNDREDFNGPSWELNAIWKPYTYTRFQLTSLQEDRESTGEGSFVNFRETRAEWSMDWTVRMTSRLFIGMGSKSFEDSIPNRDDDLFSAGMSIEYELRRWLDLGFRAEHSTVESTLNEYDFERHQFTVYLNAAI